MTLVEVMILISIVAIALAFAVAVREHWPRRGPHPPKYNCIANLRQIDGAKEQWALENKKTVGTPADVAAVNSYLKNSAAPECHGGGTYTYNPVGKAPTCSLGATLGHTL